jgi:hypothetical protein
MAKATKPSKKKKAAAKSAKKKKVAVKKTAKKSTPKKKVVKKKAAKKKPVKKAVKKAVAKKTARRTAARSSVTSGAEAESGETVLAEPQCKCKEKNGVFFLMVKQKNGNYKKSPLHSPFETLAECETHCIPQSPDDV